jgi:hypothetical protein
VLSYIRRIEMKNKLIICFLLIGNFLIEEAMAASYSGTPAYTPNFIGAMAEVANSWKYDNLTMQQHYNNDIKFLGFVSGSFFEIAGVNIYFDLTDYYSSVHNVEISKEGCDYANPADSDWITIWVDFEIGAKVGILPANAGIIPIDISEYADPPRSLDVSILSSSLPICKLEGITSTSQGYDWGQSEWTIQTNFSASLISFGINIARFEIKRSVLDSIVNGTFPLGTISGTTLQNAADNICEDITCLDSFKAMPSISLLNSIRMFTRDDISVSQYDGAIGHIASGFDLDGNGSRDNYYKVSPYFLGIPIIVLDCDVTFQNTGDSTADYFVEVTNIPDGWYIGCVDGFNNPGDHKYDITGVSPSIWTGTKWVATPWQIGVEKDAPDEATVTFSLYHDTVFENTLLDSKDITLHKFKDTFEQALTAKGTNGNYIVGGIAQYLSREPDEPDHAGITGHGSVWMKWIAPNDGTVTFNTQGSGYDTLLAVYTGSTLSNLIEVASNNDYDTNTYSRVDFTVSANTEYYIVIDTNEILGTSIDDVVYPHISYQYLSFSSYKITPIADSHGSISPGEDVYANPGSSLTFNANPDNGYVVSRWELDGELVQTGGNSYQLTNIQSNHNLNVFFIVGLSEPTEVSGPISTNTTWSLSHNPYIVTGDVTVNSGVTLTIEAGVVVKFQAVDTGNSTVQRHKLIVDGTLNIQGVSGNEVVFTSSRDDSYGGDSNGDGTATTPSPGKWGYVKINNASSTIHHAIFRYGGLGYNTYNSYGGGYYDYYDKYMLWVNNCSPIITNCRFEQAYERGLYYYANQNYDTTPQITNNNFVNCPYGLDLVGSTQADTIGYIAYNDLDGCSQVGLNFKTLSGGSVACFNVLAANNYAIKCNSCFASIFSNNIYDSTSYGLYNETPSIVVGAINNWWGHSSGPTHVGNPGGQGDVVSDGVDYSDWKTSYIYTISEKAPEIVSIANTNATIGGFYVYDSDNTAEASGNPPITWCKIYGPSGFIIDPSSGQIIWVPDNVGEYTVALMAKNAYGCDVQTFKVFVGFGGFEIVMPDVTNLSYDAAEQLLTDAGLLIGDLSYRFDDNITVDSVIRQSPEPDRYVNTGTPVNLLLSRGIEGNLNLDNQINLQDFAILSSYWQNNCNASNNWCDYSDFDLSGSVGFEDLMVIVNKWLEKGIVRIHSEKLDSDPGWTTQGQWQFGVPVGAGGSSYGYSDPYYGYTGNNVYGVNLHGDYSTSPGGPYYLTAGPFDLSGHTNVHLKFARWLNCDESLYAKAAIEVSNDGSNWHIVWQHSGTEPITDSEWTIVNYDISQYADNQATVYIRWSYRILDWAYPYSGWNIDDIEIIEQFKYLCSVCRYVLYESISNRIT